jgi:hypothetical protein
MVPIGLVDDPGAGQLLAFATQASYAGGVITYAWTAAGWKLLAGASQPDSFSGAVYSPSDGAVLLAGPAT